MAKNHSSSSGGRHLREKISDMVHNIEAIMVNINSVLCEVTILVKEIDTITERLETHYDNKIKRREILLDANRNHCEMLGTPGVSSQSKTIPSPYMDYTYLELTNDCDTCHENVHSFTFNEKYPLWIQYGTWKAGNSISEISEVSSGSDSHNMAVESDDKSWKSVSNIGRNSEYVKRNNLLNKGKCKFEEEDIVKFTKCCNSTHNDLSEKYCGVYEQIMEQQLEDLETLSFDFIETNQFSDTVSSGCTSEDLSQEFMPTGYFPQCSTTSCQNHPTGVTVREFSDSNSNTSE